MNFRLLLGPKEWGIFLSFLGEGAKDDGILLQLQRPRIRQTFQVIDIIFSIAPLTKLRFRS